MCLFMLHKYLKLLINHGIFAQIEQIACQVIGMQLFIM